MGQLFLTMENLKDLDYGRVGEAFTRALQLVVRDCLDRPGLETAREVAIDIKVKPVAVTNGQTISCEGAKAVVVVKAKVPPRESGVLDFGVRETGALVFSEDSPANHRQETLLEE